MCKSYRQTLHRYSANGQFGKLNRRSPDPVCTCVSRTRSGPRRSRSSRAPRTSRSRLPRCRLQGANALGRLPCSISPISARHSRCDTSCRYFGIQAQGHRRAGRPPSPMPASQRSRPMRRRYNLWVSHVAPNAIDSGDRLRGAFLARVVSRLLGCDWSEAQSFCDRLFQSRSCQLHQCALFPARKPSSKLMIP